MAQIIIISTSPKGEKAAEAFQDALEGKKPSKHREATWQFNEIYDKFACKFLADRYRKQGLAEEAECVEHGISVDHDCHVALVILTEFLQSRLP